MSSPALDVPIRDKKEIALIIARKALEEIAGDTYERYVRDRANAALDRLRVLLNNV